MDPRLPDPRLADLASRAERIRRRVLFGVLVALTPVAAFLCGFCCCWVSYSVFDSGPDCIDWFPIGAALAAIVSVISLIVVYKRWFKGGKSDAARAANHD
jgi:hypothetical protein